MAKVHVVHVPFSREHPVTGKLIEYKRGDVIAEPAVLDDMAGSDHEAHGRAAELPDDHHHVLPHLPDGHPLKPVAPDEDEAPIARPHADDE
jgi:hypothetical protein